MARERVVEPRYPPLATTVRATQSQPTGWLNYYMTTHHIDRSWFDRTVRQTEDGKASVLDLIRNAITGRGERMVWKRLKEEHPELEELTRSVTFRNGSNAAHATPVVDVEGWLQILALLPGAAGKRYRKKAAELVVRVWRGDADLGLAIMLRDIDKQRLNRAKSRLRVTDLNNQVTQASAENGEKPDWVHDARYRGLYKMRTPAVRKEMGLAKDECPLDYMDSADLAMHETIQHVALKAQEAHGGNLQTKVHSAAVKMRDYFEDVVGSAPALPDPVQVGHMSPRDARVIKASAESGQLKLFS